MTMLAFLPGGWEIWVILFIALLLFANRIPGMARSLGSGIVEFKKGLKGEDEESKKLGQGSSGGSEASRDGDKAASSEGSKS